MPQKLIAYSKGARVQALLLQKSGLRV